MAQVSWRPSLLAEGPRPTTMSRSPTTVVGWTAPRRFSSSSRTFGESGKPPSVRPNLVGDHPPLDVNRIVEIFERHRVRYLLVGGVAARLHGATRPTEDVDVLPADDDENLRRLAAALTELGAFLRVGGLSDDEARALPVQLDGATLRGMEVSTWRTTAGDLDVLRSLRDMDGGRRSYVELEQRSIAISTNDVEIRLAGLGDIIDSKRFADREKDHDALPELEALRAASTEGDDP